MQLFDRHAPFPQQLCCNVFRLIAITVFQLPTDQRTTTTQEYTVEIGYLATCWMKYVLHASFIEFITHIEITITRM